MGGDKPPGRPQVGGKEIRKPSGPTLGPSAAIWKPAEPTLGPSAANRKPAEPTLGPSAGAPYHRSRALRLSRRLHNGASTGTDDDAGSSAVGEAG